MFIRQFLALKAHARAVSQSHWQSFFPLQRFSDNCIMALTYSISPCWFSWSSFYFNIGIFTKINDIFWNKFASIVTVNWIECSKYTYPLFQKIFIVFGCLFLMVAPVLEQENSSIKWGYQRFSLKWWRSIPCH